MNIFLTLFTDSDWVCNEHKRKSIIGNAFKLIETQIYWIMKKQNCIALYSSEADYISATSGPK